MPSTKKNLADPGSAATPAPGSSENQSPTGPGWCSTEDVHASFRADLWLMAGLAGAIRAPGLPEAGALAQHAAVVLLALRHHLRFAEALRRCPAPGRETRGGAEIPRPPDPRAVLIRAVEVEKRLGRLYQADRPGGLDHLDAHLTLLAEGAEEYLRHIESRLAAFTDPPAFAWFADAGPSARARLVAWVLTANASARRPGGLPLRTRLLLDCWALPRARQRRDRMQPGLRRGAGARRSPAGTAQVAWPGGPVEGARP